MNTDWEAFTYEAISERTGGKILFQPRILCWYSDKIFARQSLGNEYDGLKLSEIYRKLDLCNRIYDYGACIQRVVEDKRILHRERAISPGEREFQIDTPVGSMTMRLYRNASNGGEFYSKWWVENQDDLRVYTYYEKASQWKFYPEIYKSIREEWGTLGAPTLFLPRTTLMHAYLDTMGVETATYALCDTPEQVEEYFDALNESHGRYIEVLNRTDINLVNFGDNVHCGLVPDRYFERYLLPAYRERTEKLHRSGKFVSAHWDGDTRHLLKYLRFTGLDAVEAVTPKPQGDVTLQEVKEALGEKMFLMDGIAAILFAEPYSEEQLIAQTEELIRLFAPRLILGISDELASFGDMERVKLVQKMVKEYNRGIEKEAGK